MFLVRNPLMAAGKCLLLVVVLLLLAFVTLTLFDIFIFFLFILKLFLMPRFRASVDILGISQSFYSNCKHVKIYLITW